jgi:hypothetical protein
MYIPGAHIEHGGKCYNLGMGNIVSISETIKLYLLTTVILSNVMFILMFLMVYQVFYRNCTHFLRKFEKKVSYGIYIRII